MSLQCNSPVPSLEQSEYLSIVAEFQALLEVEICPAYHRLERGELYDTSPRRGGYISPALWRETFVSRCYNMLGLPEFPFSRETIDIAMSYLDAYLYRKGGDIFGANDDINTAVGETKAEPMIKLDLLIASSACLFLAIKLHEPDHYFDISTLVRINNGHFTRQDIINAEKDILITLDFRISPPTVMSFIRIYLALLEGSGSAIAISGEAPLSEEAINQVTGLAKSLSELSLYDIFFVDKDVSKIALACVLTAFEGISCEAIPQAYRQRVVDCVHREGNLNCTDECVYKCMVQLRIALEARLSVRGEQPS